jgi:hypothetical protein
MVDVMEMNWNLISKDARQAEGKRRSNMVEGWGWCVENSRASVEEKSQRHLQRPNEKLT